MKISTRICNAIVIACAFCLLPAISPAGTGAGDASALAGLQTKLEKLQIPFVANQGQTHRDVAFYAQTGGGTFFVTARGEFVYALTKAQEPSMAVIKETLRGAKAAKPRSQQASASKVNYFKGSDPRGWRAHIATFDSLTLGEVYPGVELSLKAYGNRVEKIFTVKPGADVKQIRMQVNGARAMSVTAGGELALATGLGIATFTKPVAFQEISGRKKHVDAAYKVAGSTYTFTLGEYDRTRPLVIDPMLATFLGSSDLEYGYSLDTLYIDKLYVYVVGSTTSRTDFPNKTGVQTSYGGGDHDAFVARLDSTLRVLETTYLGGGLDDEGLDIATVSFNDPNDFDPPYDKMHYVYVVGFTKSSNFPAAPTSARGRGGEMDGFITRLSPDLSVIQQSRYLGGTYADAAVGLCMGNDSVFGDPSSPPDSIYVVGSTHSPDFPLTAGSAQPVHGSPISNDDGYIARLDLDLGLIKASYLGGCSGDSANAVAIDGDVYITGTTQYNPFCDECIINRQNIGCFPWIEPTSFGGEHSDAFVVRISSDLTEVDNATYLGGDGVDFG